MGSAKHQMDTIDPRTARAREIAIGEGLLKLCPDHDDVELDTGELLYAEPRVKVIAGALITYSSTDRDLFDTPEHLVTAVVGIVTAAPSECACCEKRRRE